MPCTEYRAFAINICKLQKQSLLLNSSDVGYFQGYKNQNLCDPWAMQELFILEKNAWVKVLFMCEFREQGTVFEFHLCILRPWILGIAGCCGVNSLVVCSVLLEQCCVYLQMSWVLCFAQLGVVSVHPWPTHARNDGVDRGQPEDPHAWYCQVRCSFTVPKEM